MLSLFAAKGSVLCRVTSSSSRVQPAFRRRRPSMPSHPSAAFSILRTVDEVRQWRATLADPSSLGFVPTMGALHEGHLQLVRHSLSSQKHTLVSIFLNPAQFGPTEDLAHYPSTLDSDLEHLAALEVSPGSLGIPHDGFDGRSVASPDPQKNAPQLLTKNVAEQEALRQVSAVFLPSNDILYPSGISTKTEDQRGAFVTVHGLSEQLEGARRPGFFRGVATVVLKLFLIVEPSIAFFGQKDLQQCLLVRQLCKDMHVSRPRAIVATPTVRDPGTGLALSSRNAYLSTPETLAAKALFEFLNRSAQSVLASGRTPSLEHLAQSFTPPLESFALDFISLNHPVTFADIPAGTALEPTSPLAISGAMLVHCSSSRVVRLIDNIVLNHDLNCDISYPPS
ncbi:hypothetical protein PCANC_17356 [Puccinia coronata f. sp. avenae]|nr:hypothetical protein PCANC_17356 [Puccinia coronata f. sp. avenae]